MRYKTTVFCVLSVLCFAFTVWAAKSPNSDGDIESEKNETDDVDFVDVSGPSVLDETVAKIKEVLQKKQGQAVPQSVIDMEKIEKELTQIKRGVPSVGNVNIGPMLSVAGVTKGLGMLKNLRLDEEDSNYLAQILKKFIGHFKSVIQNAGDIGQKTSIYALVSFVLDGKFTSTVPKNYGSFGVKIIGSLTVFVTIVLFIFGVAKGFYTPLKDYAFIAETVTTILPIFIFIVGTKLFWDQCCSCCSVCNPFIEKRKRKEHALFKMAKEQWIEFGDEIGMDKNGASLVGLLDKKSKDEQL